MSSVFNKKVKLLQRHFYQQDKQDKGSRQAIFQKEYRRGFPFREHRHWGHKPTCITYFSIVKPFRYCLSNTYKIRLGDEHKYNFCRHF